MQTQRLRTPPLPCRAHKLLSDWLCARPRGALSELARRLELPKATVCACAKGRRRLTGARAWLLEAVAGIPAEAWLSDEERSAIRRARALS